MLYNYALDNFFETRVRNHDINTEKTKKIVNHFHSSCLLVLKSISLSS